MNNEKDNVLDALQEQLENIIKASQKTMVEISNGSMVSLDQIACVQGECIDEVTNQKVCVILLKNGFEITTDAKDYFYLRSFLCKSIAPTN